MKQLLLSTALVGFCALIGAGSSNTSNGTANAQFASLSVQSGDAIYLM